MILFPYKFELLMTRFSFSFFSDCKKLIFFFFFLNYTSHPLSMNYSMSFKDIVDLHWLRLLDRCVVQETQPMVLTKSFVNCEKNMFHNSKE